MIEATNDPFNNLKEEFHALWEEYKDGGVFSEFLRDCVIPSLAGYLNSHDMLHVAAYFLEFLAKMPKVERDQLYE